MLVDSVDADHTFAILRETSPARNIELRTVATVGAGLPELSGPPRISTRSSQGWIGCCPEPTHALLAIESLSDPWRVWVDSVGSVRR